MSRRWGRRGCGRVGWLLGRSSDISIPQYCKRYLCFVLLLLFLLLMLRSTFCGLLMQRFLTFTRHLLAISPSRRARQTRLALWSLYLRLRLRVCSFLGIFSLEPRFRLLPPHLRIRFRIWLCSHTRRHQRRSIFISVQLQEVRLPDFDQLFISSAPQHQDNSDKRKSIRKGDVPPSAPPPPPPKTSRPHS